LENTFILKSAPTKKKITMTPKIKGMMLRFSEEKRSNIQIKQLNKIKIM
jgi:hypothetical protein